MEAIYDEKLILNYINRKNMKECDIKQLEDDYIFMIQVMDYTNDKTVYNSCSKKVKNNYDFVKYVISKFDNDLKFICSVANSYIKNNNDIMQNTELLIIMQELTKNSKYYQKYKTLAGIFYYKSVIQFSNYASENKDGLPMLYKTGLGFGYIINQYGKSEIILKYFAEKFLDDIFINCNGLDLESLIHIEFDNFSQLEEMGIDRYILSMVFMYDIYLYNYIVGNLDILSKIKKEIHKMKINWNLYESAKERKLYSNVIDQVYKYLVNNQLTSDFGEKILYCIGRELNILNKLKRNYCLTEEACERLSHDNSTSKGKMSYDDLKHYQNIRRIVVDVLLYDGAIEMKEPKYNTKVLKFTSSNNEQN